ncbi:hypothetical protein ACA29_20750, partial [Lederbergia galactosidilytica]
MDKEKVGVKTPEYISLQFQLAGLGSRTVAFIIDNIIISIAMVIIMLVGFLLVYAISEIPFMSDAISYLFVFMIIGLFLLNYGYFVVLEFFWG